MGGNSNNPDISNYIYSYSMTGFDRHSDGAFGYEVMKNFAQSLGISFRNFRLILYLLGLTNFYIFLKKLNVSNLMMILCYSLSLMMIDSTQTYNFIGMTFLLLAISYLITDNKFGKLNFFICLIGATSFHSVFILYLPLLFFYDRIIDNEKMKFYLFFFSFFIIISLLPIADFIGSSLSKLLPILQLSSYLSYLNSRTNFGHLYPISIHLLSTSFVYFLYRLSVVQGLKCQEMLRKILFIHVYAFVFFPLFKFQLTLGRLTRNIEILTFVSGLVYSLEKKNINTTFVVYGALIFLALLMGYNSVYSDYYYSIVKPFIESNWILYGGN